ncbi:MAG: PIG-L deacetylase family protein [Candidatus Helarchaeota archaeon]
MNKNKKLKVLFFSPHPDDIEFACASTEVELVKNGHRVIEACFTADEYGTDRDDFKGERISKIRRREMREAARVVGIHELYWLGYIDGYSRFDRESIDRLKKFLLKINPDLIFAPDPFFTIDNHVDHVNLGKTVFYIWQRLKKKPPLLLYYTYKPNYYINAQYKEKAREAFKKHVSQGFSKPLFLHFSWILKFIFGFFTPHSFFPETYRIVGVKKNYDNPIKTPIVLKKILKQLLRAGNFAFMPGDELYKPTPKELNIKEFRFNI